MNYKVDIYAARLYYKVVWEEKRYEKNRDVIDHLLSFIPDKV